MLLGGRSKREKGKKSFIVGVLWQIDEVKNKALVARLWEREAGVWRNEDVNLKFKMKKNEASESSSRNFLLTRGKGLKRWHVVKKPKIDTCTGEEELLYIVQMHQNVNCYFKEYKAENNSYSRFFTSGRENDYFLILGL